MIARSKTVLTALIILAASLSACGAQSGLPPDPLENKQYTIKSYGPKKRVGIVKFTNKAPYAKARRVGEAIVDIVTTELAKTDAFIVVERAELDEVLKEQALGQSGAVNTATAAQAGRILGLQALIIGTISEFGVKTQFQDFLLFKQRVQAANATVDVRLVDSTTGQIIYADSGTGEFKVKMGTALGLGAKGSYDEQLGQLALRAAVVQFMQNLINQLDTQEWRGKVVKVDAGKGSAIINAGQETGLKVGDVLIVNKLGEMLTDPDTGLELGREVGDVVGELEVLSFFGKDAAKCRVVGGRRGISAGDQVMMKEKPAVPAPGPSTGRLFDPESARGERVPS